MNRHLEDELCDRGAERTKRDRAITHEVNLAATGLCWVDATEASTGAVLWTGTLQTGQSRAIAATGSLVLRLGAANDVNVTLNGEPVVLPTGFRSPFDMRFGAT